MKTTVAIILTGNNIVVNVLYKKYFDVSFVRKALSLTFLHRFSDYSSKDNVKKRI